MKKGEYVPHVYKFLISPYYANYTLLSKLSHDDAEDWKMIANCASGKETIRAIVHREVDDIFDKYDYGQQPEEEE